MSSKGPTATNASCRLEWGGRQSRPRRGFRVHQDGRGLPSYRTNITKRMGGLRPTRLTAETEGCSQSTFVCEGEEGSQCSKIRRIGAKQGFHH